jgi:sulfate-transporting ATPase
MSEVSHKIIFSMVGVSKTIPPSRQILKDIYLSFYYGAKIGIIGMNGSGKSTLAQNHRWARPKLQWQNRIL